MERGAQLFFEGLMQEMSPALDELAELFAEAGPALEAFVKEMGPKLRDVLEEVEDWSVYEAPEVLPNGDIIIRRKPEAPVGPLRSLRHRSTFSVLRLSQPPALQENLPVS